MVKMYVRRSRTLVAALTLTVWCLFAAGCAVNSASVVQADYKQIVIATGSPYELGLVDELAKAFQKKHGGVIRCIKTPTGPGLDLGRHGLTHITMGHERAATARFAKEGYAARRTDLMHNFTVVVGPAGDPAKIEGLTSIKEVQKRIYEAKAPYLSRGDGGGMDILERKTWKDLGVTAEGQSWYQVSKKFMLASLLDADKNGQYHMLDSSTWALHKSKTKGLKLLVKGPPNEYEMCLVNTEKHPHLKYNQDLAEKFYDFLIGEEGQKIIAEFGIKQYGEPIYYPTVIKFSK
ncbi:MAG: substrate-binding domain-containing protein [Deltaproteobacteria bacterium]|mgnify:FL=1|jgi:tungstate transport system substrate-binding protein